MKSLALLLLLAPACVDELQPQTGQQVSALCNDADSDPATKVSFATDIVPLLGKRCYFCHAPTSMNPIGIEIGGLNLSTYDTLRAGGRISGANIVIPGSPCESVIVQKISPGPPFGNRMPLSGPPFLDDSDIQLIHDWIAEGAHEN